MNMLALGQISAQQLGLPCGSGAMCWWRRPAWMVGVSVALAGAMALLVWVNCTSSSVVWFNQSSRILPGCALAGASALLLADVVARLALAAAELPIGVVTATFGVRGVYLVIVKSRR
ncbi:iron chelate uptake ABC transporter family permease subunit [Shigella flexneri]